MSTGYVWDRGYLGHFTSTVHPERAIRVERLDPRDVGGDVTGLTRIDVDRGLGLPGVSRVHDADYVQEVRTAFAQGRRTLDNGETRVSEDSFEVALASAAGAMSLTAAVCSGKVNNGFASVRPPGHHAAASRARGFCLFNNVAAAARFAQHAHGLARVLIIDWDVHPADGTMSIFYDDPSVHVVSIHQDGIFTDQVGTREQTGRGEGEGTTYNLPLPEGSRTGDYMKELEPTLVQAAARCRPDLIIISAGFDAHQGDPIGGMRLDEHSFRVMTRLVNSIARDWCDGRVVSVLEGGYNPVVLRRSVIAHLEELTAA